MPKILFLTDRGERHQQSALSAAPPGYEIIMRRNPPLAEIMPFLPGIEFLITERNYPVSAEIIRTAPNLKLIVRLGSLSYDIDTEAARAAGVRVSVQPVLGSIYCAEHALMMILALVKRLGRSLVAANAADHGQSARRTDEDVFAFNWLNYHDVGGLIGKHVAILGMGEIGVELARMLRGLRPAVILYTKRRPYPPQVERELDVRYAAMAECCQNADILVSLLPFGLDTDYLRGGGLTHQKIAAMKPGAMLVHLGSGSVIDETAVVAALKSGQLAGAAFDTFEYEPLQPDHPLVALARAPDSNVLLTPHTAAAWVGGDRSGDYGEIVRFLAGYPLHYAVV